MCKTFSKYAADRARVASSEEATAIEVLDAAYLSLPSTTTAPPAT